MTEPIIGISAYVEQAQWGAWDKTAVLVPAGYVDLVHEAGGRAVVVPPLPTGNAALVRHLDGLILAGGADVEPARYGAEPHPETYTRPDRDAGEFPLLDAALTADLPVLAICRGMELLTVAYGGTLHQHLPDLVGHERHRPDDGVYGNHPVAFTPGSQAAKIFGEAGEVNAYHHQAVDDSGRITVSGRADDGVIEAVEDPAMRFVVGVQWHPEEAGDVRPFEALVRAAQ